MEPLLPEDREGRLSLIALEVIRHAERLRGHLHPLTRQGVAELVRSMNSYYSNLIEGHRTLPRDIDSALRREFSGNTTQQNLQQLHVAHVETERWMEQQVDALAAGDICHSGFLADLHREFHRRLPDDFRWVVDEKGRKFPVEPGQFRSDIVSVGWHLAPAHEHLESFLKRFADGYGPQVLPTPQGLIAAAAAHHRLAWIHPFLDGNGRVTRLFTQAWLRKSGASADGLWTLSRGLARAQTRYKAALANADEKRMNDFDGRGYLSERRLAEFCEFLLQAALDQLKFMEELLQLDGMERRIVGYATREETAGNLPKGSGLLLREVFLRGQVGRGELASVLGVTTRTTQNVIRKLLEERLLVSDSMKRPVRLGIPGKAAGSYFPNLFPAGAEE